MPDNDKNQDEISELLKKFYKPKNETNPDQFWDELSKKIDCLFHREIFTDRVSNSEGKILTDEEKYWLGLEEYINNEVNSLKHKSITDHILDCKECRKNYNNLLDKKKIILDVNKEFFLASFAH